MSYLFTVDFHQQHGAGVIEQAIELTADPLAPANRWANEQSWTADDNDKRCFMVGYMTVTIGNLLDALGFPQQGPNVDQVSWLAIGDTCPACGMEGGPGPTPGSYSGCPTCGWCA